MLAQYTKITDLTPDAQTRLKSLVRGMMVEGQGYFAFEGKFINKAEIAQYKKMWEAQANGRTTLFG